MTEETKEQPNNNVNISVEQILAAILNQTGDVNVKLEDLVANYSSKTIAINQLEDKSVTFSLVDLPVQPVAETEESAE